MAYGLWPMAYGLWLKAKGLMEYLGQLGLLGLLRQ